MGSANTKRHREQKRVAPLHKGEFAIPDLAPELREKIEKNDGMVDAFRDPPSTSDDAPPRYVSYRIRLTGNYELWNGKNQKLADLYRDLSIENKHIIALKSKTIFEKGRQFRYVIRILDSHMVRKKGIRHDVHSPAIGVAKIPVQPSNGGW